MKISLCMIVKNEEDLLKKCLRHVYTYVDEIVIVDTGSTDKTKEIARHFTDKIYDFLWCNDFSKARNFSLSQATNDWVLVLDADEIVTEFNRKSLLSLVSKNLAAVGRIKILNCIDEKWGTSWHTERINRFFNKNFFNYEGIIHEQVVHIDAGYDYKTFSVDITVTHDGYIKEVIDKKAKLERNISLLKQSLLANPNDPYLYYQLGKSYYMGKDYEQASASFNKALSFPLNFAYEYVQDLVETFGYALLNNEKYDEALQIEQFEEYYQTSPDFCFVLGLIYMNNARFSKAVESFTKCIGTTDGKIKGINSHLANYNIAVIYESLGFIKEAIAYYKQCGNYQPAKKRLVILK